MKLPDPSSGGDFTPTPAGQHMAVLTRLIDLGTQPGSQMYPSPKHKMLFGWEIPSERVSWEKDGQVNEGPVVHFERMTFSMHENAIMRQRLESWRGRAFTEEEYQTFDMKTLLGVGALIQIAHEHKDGKTYANMQAILLPPGGKGAWSKPEGEFIFLDLSNFDQLVFDNLSEGLQGTITRSPEYQELFAAPSGSSNGQAENPETDDPFGGGDSIPF